ncbi:sorbosone dehydrogenase family protein [Anaeromyxobacter sp. SG64]|uniref:PQQ-dependent sugar dehydrogenase n=1 Tax=Anaeromyxobacter sp. SG64 TaxID=2925409 RepID=UPI001F570E67|nr:PQQ-dependent sugar dehydrogenase [Anaeromyxobacter sp. SG64]
MHRPGALAAACLLAALSARCGGSAASGDGAAAPGCTLVEDGWGPAGTVPIRVERVATGLEVPWAIAFLPGGDALVTERPGRIRLLRGGALEAEPVATVPVVAEGEGGLLGIAADPGFAENRRFYTYHTADEDGRRVNRVTRWLLAEDRRSARVERVILDGIPAAVVHDGGRLRFGPDGQLYVGTGDAREPARAQDRGSLGGKLLRVTTEGAPADGNPFPGSPVFLLGIRNTQAFDFLDARTLVVGDHGPSGDTGRSGHDEVDVARAGANLGWPDVYSCDTGEGVTTPAIVWSRAAPPGGGSVYRGEAVPAWKGSFLVGILGARHLHRIVLREDGRVQAHEVYLQGEPPEGLGRVRDVQQGPDGAVWVTTSNCDGRGTCPPEKDVVARIVAR